MFLPLLSEKMNTLFPTTGHASSQEIQAIMANPLQIAQQQKLIEEHKKQLEALTTQVDLVQKQSSEAMTSVKRVLIRKAGRDVEEEDEIEYESKARVVLLRHGQFNNNGKLVGFKSDGLTLEQRVEILEQIVLGRHENWLKELQG